jgi:hypothetical protein
MGQGSGTCFTIDSSQRAGFGTTSPEARIHAVTTSAAQPAIKAVGGSTSGVTKHALELEWSGFYWGSSSQVALNIVDTRTAAATDRQVQFSKGGSVVGSISTSLTTTTYATSSDYRLKEDIQPVDSATARLLQLKPCNFAWKADGTRVDGFIAHELAEVIPEAVTGEKDAMKTVVVTEAQDATYWTEEDELPEGVTVGDVKTAAVEEITEEQPDYQGIDQSKIVPLLVATIQELEARIKALESA